YQKPKDSETDIISSPDLLLVKLRYKPIDSDISDKVEVSVADDGPEHVSRDFRFASSVAMMGLLLRDSKYKADATYDKLIEQAGLGLDNDDLGYRREFIRLAGTAKSMSGKK
ncbi:MAG TPA: hypothetical protein DEQ30_04495, partial [Porphyromonadaceae bacterium]|nr:hypothetical protein [Porphyromonadaceae bacterium]